MCGHVTDEEQVKLLRNSPEVSNGSMNRFLFVWTGKYVDLPDGGNPDAAELARIGRQLKQGEAGALTLGKA